MNLKILSWNIKGLNDKKKRNKVERIVEKQNLDIECIRETHINKKHTRVLINPKLGSEFITADDKKKKEVW